MKVVRILGIDPGSRLTGYGCVDLVGNQIRHVTHGTLRLSNTGGKATIPLEHRLLWLHEGLLKVIDEFSPTIMVVERVFFAKNAVSALKLGQARGAVVLSGAIRGLEIVEYSPTEVKSAVVGQGHADKEQVARMVQILTKCGEFATSDASDGLALAVCHAQFLATEINRPSAYATALRDAAGGRKSSNRRLSLAESLGITADSTAVRTLGKGPTKSR